MHTLSRRKRILVLVSTPDDSMQKAGRLGEGAMAGQRSQADLSQGLQVQCSPSRALALGAAPVAGGREHAPLFSVQGPIFFSHLEGRNAMELLPTSLHVTVK